MVEAAGRLHRLLPACVVTCIANMYSLAWSAKGQVCVLYDAFHSTKEESGRNVHLFESIAAWTQSPSLLSASAAAACEVRGCCGGCCCWPCRKLTLAPGAAAVTGRGCLAAIGQPAAAGCCVAVLCPFPRDSIWDQSSSLSDSGGGGLCGGPALRLTLAMPRCPAYALPLFSL